MKFLNVDSIENNMFFFILERKDLHRKIEHDFSGGTTKTVIFVTKERRFPPKLLAYYYRIRIAWLSQNVIDLCLKGREICSFVCGSRIYLVRMKFKSMQTVDVCFVN